MCAHMWPPVHAAGPLRGLASGGVCVLAWLVRGPSSQLLKLDRGPSACPEDSRRQGGLLVTVPPPGWTARSVPSTRAQASHLCPSRPAGRPTRGGTWSNTQASMLSAGQSLQAKPGAQGQHVSSTLVPALALCPCPWSNTGPVPSLGQCPVPVPVPGPQPARASASRGQWPGHHLRWRTWRWPSSCRGEYFGGSKYSS